MTYAITEPSIYVALDYLLERLPAQMHLVATTRRDPPLGLARLRARGGLAEFRLHELRFSLEKVSAFHNDKPHLGLARKDLEALRVRAEGWAAGLRLLASPLGPIGSAGDRTAFIQSLAQVDRYVFDFLADEVLKRHGPDTRGFLLQTSIPSKLTPTLCAAVARFENAQPLLEALYRRNLFLVQIDGTGKGQDPNRAFPACSRVFFAQ